MLTSLPHPTLNGHDLREIYRTGVKSCKFPVNYGMHWRGEGGTFQPDKLGLVQGPNGKESTV